MQKKAGGRPATYAVTVSPPNQAPHIVDPDPRGKVLSGAPKRLAIEELNEVQVLRAMIRQRVEDAAPGELTRIAIKAGVTPQWLTRLLRWRDRAPTLSDRPPQSVSFAKLRWVAEAAGVPARLAVQRILPPESFEEFLDRTGSRDGRRHLDDVAMALLGQMSVDERRRVVWQLRGLLERRPGGDALTCSVCGAGMDPGDARRLGAICLECVGSPTGVLPAASRRGPDYEDEDDEQRDSALKGENHAN